MRRVSVLLTFFAVVLPGLVGPPTLRPAAAQEATPAASPAAEGELPPGVSLEFIAGAPVAELPPTSASMVLVRLTLQPGAVLPVSPDDPSGSLVVVEAGTLTVRFEDAATESTYGLGDAFYGPPFVAGEVSNRGPEPAVLLLAIVAPEEGESGAATPAP